VDRRALTPSLSRIGAEAKKSVLTSEKKHPLDCQLQESGEDETPFSRSFAVELPALGLLACALPQSEAKEKVDAARGRTTTKLGGLADGPLPGGI
jgi:hypothetical protein